MRILDHAACIAQTNQDDVDLVLLQPLHRLRECGLEILERHPRQRIGRADLPQHQIRAGQGGLGLDPLGGIGRQLPGNTAMNDFHVQSLEGIFEELLHNGVVSAGNGAACRSRRRSDRQDRQLPALLEDRRNIGQG